MKRGEFLRIEGSLAIFEKIDDGYALVSDYKTGDEKWYLIIDETTWQDDQTGNTVEVEIHNSDVWCDEFSNVNPGWS